MAVTTGGNVRLRAARKERGLASQSDFVNALSEAARENGIGELSVNTRTVRRWESDTPGWPHRSHARALEVLFGVPITELGFTPRSGHASRLAGSYSPAAGPTLPRSPGRPQHPTRFRDTIPAVAAPRYAELTAAYRSLYWLVPATMLQSAVFRHAELGSALCDAAQQDVAVTLAPSAAEAWMLAGRLLLFDLQDPGSSRPCFYESLQCAQVAHDDALGAAALAHLAGEAARNTNGSARAREIIRAARGFTLRASEPPRLIAWLDIVESEIEARLGNHNHAATLITHAEQAYRGCGTEIDPPWLDWFSAHRLTTAKANTLLAAGRRTDARLALERALNELPETDTKLRALTYCDLAAVAALAREPVDACTLLTKALDELGSGSYASATARITAVRAMLTDWNDTPAVRALDTRLTEWSTTLMAVTA
jgi:hypothetical protein